MGFSIDRCIGKGSTKGRWRDTSFLSLKKKERPPSRSFCRIVCTSREDRSKIIVRGELFRGTDIPENSPRGSLVYCRSSVHEESRSCSPLCRLIRGQENANLPPIRSSPSPLSLSFSRSVSLIPGYGLAFRCRKYVTPYFERLS